MSEYPEISFGNNFYLWSDYNSLGVIGETFEGINLSWDPKSVFGVELKSTNSRFFISDNVSF